MGGQRNKHNVKEQENSPVGEMEANNLSDREFEVMIIRIFHSMKKT